MVDKTELIYKDLYALEERVAELEKQLDALEALRDRVDDIDARTDIMQLVEDSDDLDGKGRSIRLLQHMQRKASRQNLTTISLTRDQADEALHYPDVDRTTIYTDMRRCVRLLGDEAICWYEGSDQGTHDESEVYLDVTALQDAATAGEVDPELVAESTVQQGGA